jgi:hypothetical protein
MDYYHTIPSIYFKIKFNIILPRTLKIFRVAASGFPTETLKVFPMRATVVVPLILLDFASPILFGRDNRSWPS